jgi:hypothetical protein
MNPQEKIRILAERIRSGEKKLSGSFRHFCPDWDFLEIDETRPEFNACLCFAAKGESENG